MQSSVLFGTDLSDLFGPGQRDNVDGWDLQCSLLASRRTSWSKIVGVNRPGGEKQDSIWFWQREL